MSFIRARSIRLSLGALGFLGAVFAPWWVPLVAMGALAFRYPAWEVLAIGLVVDFLWLAPRGVEGFLDLFFSLPLFTIAALLLLWGLEPLRREFIT